MNAIDPELVQQRTRVLEGHLRKLKDALQGDSPVQDAGAKEADIAALHLLLSIQVVLDLAIYACLHFGLQAPSSYDDALARLAHAGRIPDPLADRLEKAAVFRDALIHAFDDTDTAAILRAARLFPDDLRMFMADIAGHVGE